jgi:hypothetical protein
VAFNLHYQLKRSEKDAGMWMLNFRKLIEYDIRIIFGQAISKGFSDIRLM